jgi:adenylate cyclase class 2
MQPEIEAKFLNVDHDVVRQKLAELGAKLEKPMRLMRRTIFDYPDGRIERVLKGRLRVRDEGDKITVTYKSPRPDRYNDETETTVGSYETMVKLFEAIGLVPISAQESKRETWHCENVEVVLDEWPWVRTYIEIEGPSEQEIRNCAAALGFDWGDAVFGSVENVYRAEYPGMKAEETLSEIPEISFDAPLPSRLGLRRTK